ALPISKPSPKWPAASARGLGTSCSSTMWRRTSPAPGRPDSRLARSAAPPTSVRRSPGSGWQSTKIPERGDGPEGERREEHEEERAREPDCVLAGEVVQ